MMSLRLETSYIKKKKPTTKQKSNHYDLISLLLAYLPEHVCQGISSQCCQKMTVYLLHRVTLLYTTVVGLMLRYQFNQIFLNKKKKGHFSKSLEVTFGISPSAVLWLLFQPLLVLSFWCLLSTSWILFMGAVVFYTSRKSHFSINQ